MNSMNSISQDPKQAKTLSYPPTCHVHIKDWTLKIVKAKNRYPNRHASTPFLWPLSRPHVPARKNDRERRANDVNEASLVLLFHNSESAALHSHANLRSKKLRNHNPNIKSYPNFHPLPSQYSVQPKLFPKLTFVDVRYPSSIRLLLENGVIQCD